LNEEIEVEIEPLKIFVGWDSREDIAYRVCKESIEKHASVPVEVLPLKMPKLRKQGIYTRPIDPLSSTEFTFTRFLVPFLTDYTGWALFIDCDFVFLDDIKLLFDQIDNNKALMCAQHDYTPKPGKAKMDGHVQHTYPRKNWSSMMLINCGHHANSVITPNVVNDLTKTGKYFHRFTWLNDDQIGKLSHEWNWLVGWYNEPEDGTPKALHYTEGGPWFEDYENCEYNHEWYKVKGEMLEKENLGLREKIGKYRNHIPDIDELGLPDQKKNLIKDFLKYTVDPEQNFYKHDFEAQMEKVMKDGKKVLAIDSVGGINYANAGLEYDDLLTSFVHGCGGQISDWDRKNPEGDTALVIRGLGGGSRKAIQYCWNNNRTYYAIDTGYFGNGKNKRIHRVTKNGLQHCVQLLKEIINV